MTIRGPWFVAGSENRNLQPASIKQDPSLMCGCIYFVCRKYQGVSRDTMISEAGSIKIQVVWDSDTFITYVVKAQHYSATFGAYVSVFVTGIGCAWQYPSPENYLGTRCTRWPWAKTSKYGLSGY